MDTSHLDQEDGSSPETFSDSSISPDSPDVSDIFGDPLVHPRVGDEYQVEIPPILSESEALNLMMNPSDPEGIIDSAHSFRIGLSVPVMWVCNQENLIRVEMVDSANVPLGCKSKATSSEKKEPNGKNNAPNQISMDTGYCLVPGLSADSWSDFEVDCFLLGLYMFGKNLLQVKRFVDGKEMGQIQSFYYGRFYGSEGYRRWSECRKLKNRKCVLGHRFFTGYRQQELFSRLHHHLSEESKTKLLEAARAFAEGRTSLYEYVFTLKELVGIQALVEAVAIGKGKEDLTTLFLDNSKNTQMFSNRPEMPSGKACSSLTCAEIVQYLTGDFRLSKARSNDLFWEAVWPRLLARGWHSEQPRGDGYTGSKNCLVFLMPGIKKFSRRKLAKGEHYFDSVSDVLAKVASEPELLELEADETRLNSSKDENGWAVEANSNDDDDDDDDQDSSDHERRCYLKPRVSAGLWNLMKFTVVDTSLASEDNPYRVRELRSLPLEAKRPSTLSSYLRKNETKLEEAKVDSLPNGVQDSNLSAHLSGNQRMQANDLDPPKMPVDANLPTDHKSRAIKHQFSRRVKADLSNCSGQVMKRRRLASCVEAQVTCVLSLPAGKNASFRGMSKNTISPKVSPPHVKVLQTDYSVADAPSENLLEKSLVTNAVDSDLKENKSEAAKGIDLNLPQVPTESENDGKVKVEERGNGANQHCHAEKANVKEEEEEHSTNPNSEASSGACDGKKEVGSSAAVGPASKDGGVDQQPRRQSTRNRPLTTKALEALEIGFLHPVRHSRKRSPSTSIQDQKPKRARQPRSKSAIFPGVTSFEERAGADTTCNGKRDALGNPHIGPNPTQKEAASSCT